MDLNSFISNANYLPWLIPVGPLLAFLIITLLTNRSKLVPASSEEYGERHFNYGDMPVPVAVGAIIFASAGRCDLPFVWALGTPELVRAFGDVSAVPTLLLFDGEGKTAATFFGAPPTLHGAAEARLATLLK